MYLNPMKRSGAIRFQVTSWKVAGLKVSKLQVRSSMLDVQKYNAEQELGVPRISR